jgi:hypothetical protein
MRIRSHCTGHFPHVRFRDGQRYLYHAVSGKLLADRPEERVRLRSIDYLLQGDVWPAVHIATEKGSTTKGDVAAGRFDILLYNRELKPTVLIECKAPTVAISDQTSQQIARYNSEIKAPILCMTNGLIDYWFVHRADSYEPHAGVPDILLHKAPFLPDIAYWRSTGFAGTETHHDTGLTDLLGVWFSGEAAGNLINLNPGLGGTVAGMPHYYQVVQEKGMPVKLAFTIVSPDGVSTVLTVIRNVNGRNEAVLFLPLDAVYLRQETRYRLIRSSSDTERHLPEHMIDYLLEPDDAYRRLPVMLDDLFTL